LPPRRRWGCLCRRRSERSSAFNGIALTSEPANIREHPEGLFVYSLDELLKCSNRMYELLCSEDFAWRQRGGRTAHLKRQPIRDLNGAISGKGARETTTNDTS
jgi:hypothetical protein